MEKLEITIKLSLKEGYDESGMDEIFLRGMAHCVLNMINVAGRGSVEATTSYKRQKVKKKRASKRKTKS